MLASTRQTFILEFARHDSRLPRLRGHRSSTLDQLSAWPRSPLARCAYNCQLGRSTNAWTRNLDTHHLDRMYLILFNCPSILGLDASGYVGHRSTKRACCNSPSLGQKNLLHCSDRYFFDRLST
jgi:hypothetical protein